MSCAIDLTQVVNQRVELWVNDVKKSAHLSEGEAMSQASLVLDKDPSAVIDLKFVGQKRMKLTNPPVAIPVTVGQQVRLGFVSSDSAVVKVTGESVADVLAAGNVSISPTAR